MADKAKTQAVTPVVTPVVDRRVVAELVARAQADGVSISGEGGLMQQLTKIVLESSLQGDMDAHLGYDKHDPAGRDGGNSRNGTHREDGVDRGWAGGGHRAAGSGRVVRAADRA